MIDPAENVEGWLSEGEAGLLHELAAGCGGRGVIVEIGSWKGKSTIILADGSRRGPRARVYAVDPHSGSPEHVAKYGRVDTYGEFLANISRAGVGDLVVPVRKTSAEAAAGFGLGVELLFIDGAHDFASVKLDFESWFPYVVEGGRVVFHDTNWEGPGRLVRRLAMGFDGVGEFRFMDSMVCMTKLPPGRPFARTRNTAALVYSRFRRMLSGLRHTLFPGRPA